VLGYAGEHVQPLTGAAQELLDRLLIPDHLRLRRRNRRIGLNRRRGRQLGDSRALTRRDIVELDRLALGGLVAHPSSPSTRPPRNPPDFSLGGADGAPSGAADLALGAAGFFLGAADGAPSAALGRARIVGPRPPSAALGGSPSAALGGSMLSPSAGLL
jgi:hypothetical protein